MILWCNQEPCMHLSIYIVVAQAIFSSLTQSWSLLWGPVIVTCFGNAIHRVPHLILQSLVLFLRSLDLQCTQRLWIGTVPNSTEVSPRGKLRLVPESGWGTASWPRGLDLQASLRPAVRDLRGMRVAQATALGFTSFSYVWCLPTLLCWLGPLSPTLLGCQELCPSALSACRLCNFLFVQLLTWVGQPPLRWPRVYLWTFGSATQCRPCIVFWASR